MHCRWRLPNRNGQNPGNAEIPGRGTSGRTGCISALPGFITGTSSASPNPDYVLLLDNNLNQPRFWDDANAVLKQKRKPQTAYAAMQDLIASETLGYPVRGEFSGKDRPAWLRGTHAYAHLRRLAREGRIATVPIDLLEDSDRAEALANSSTIKKSCTPIHATGRTCFPSRIRSTVHRREGEHQGYDRGGGEGDVFAHDRTEAGQRTGLGYDSNRFYDQILPAARRKGILGRRRAAECQAVRRRLEAEGHGPPADRRAPPAQYFRHRRQGSHAYHARQRL